MPPIQIPGSLQPFLSAQFVLFAIFALGSIATAVVMVLQPNPVRSALFLVLNLGTPDRTRDPLRPQQPIAVLAGLILAGVIGWTALSSVRVPDTTMAALQAGAHDDLGTVERIGRNLFDPAQPWLFPFEVTSILLLIAVIGAVVLAKRRPEGER